jgi:hypothetical protein
MTTILILGSGPNATAARAWPRARFDAIVAINNAHRVRPDWDRLIHPFDFPADRLPAILRPGQRLVTETEFVPAQNAYGGFVYAGATMAFTAGYWALCHYRPATIAFFGCDMTYAPTGRTHFYGTGTPDPLRPDITLQSLEAKSARFMVMAAMQGTAVVNLSFAPSRLVFPRATLADLARGPQVMSWRDCAAATALRREASLGYAVPSGRYWEEIDRFDPAELRRLDAVWRDAARPALRRAA